MIYRYVLYTQLLPYLPPCSPTEQQLHTYTGKNFAMNSMQVLQNILWSISLKTDSSRHPKRSNSVPTINAGVPHYLQKGRVGRQDWRTITGGETSGRETVPMTSVRTRSIGSVRQKYFSVICTLCNEMLSASYSECLIWGHALLAKKA